MRRKQFTGTILLLMSALLAGLPVCAQEMDYNADQYAEYERVVAIEDPVQRADEILIFMREHEGLSLVQYALKAYGDVLEQFRTGNQFDNYLAYAEKLIAARPDDKELANNLTQQMTYAAYQAQKHEATIKYGERSYEMNPSPNLAFILANAYLKTGDQAKFKKYGDMAIKDFDPANTIEIAVQLRTKEIEKKDFAKAAEYARAVLRSLAAMKKPDSVSAGEWQKYTENERLISEMVIGRAHYEAEDYDKAVTQFEKIDNSTSDARFKGEALYYIGLSNWKTGSLDPAMRAFARGLILETPGHSEACKKYFEDLYKSTHNGSLAGSEEAIARYTQSE